MAHHNQPKFIHVSVENITIINIYCHIATNYTFQEVRNDINNIHRLGLQYHCLSNQWKTHNNNDSIFCFC